MALIKCRECGKEISNEASACPGCGAPLATSLEGIGGSNNISVRKVWRRSNYWLLGLFLIVCVIGLVASPNKNGANSSVPPQQVQPINFDLPLQTTEGALVCPFSAAFDKREGHGLQAALNSRIETFGRQKDAEKAGCMEWREGLTIRLSSEAKQQAKELQAEHNCGMLMFDEGFVSSCDLQNTSKQKLNSQIGHTPPMPPDREVPITPNNPEVVTAQHPQGEAVNPEITALLKKWNEAAEKCQTGDSNDANVKIACDQRDRILPMELKAKGWCYNDDPAVKDWGKCTGTGFSAPQKERVWLSDMSQRLAKYIPDEKNRIDFLKTLYFEAARAGLDPQLVLALIEVESGFNQYALSKTGASGYMQVMPFWVKKIGTHDQNLFDLRTNLRYGCTILRYYLNSEKGDLYRALVRYDENQGRKDSHKFPVRVRTVWLNKYANVH